jgi:hypothetical protein
MSVFRNVFLLLGAASLALGLGGCPRDPPAPAPEILSFAASPNEVEPGEEITLSWQTRHAVAVSLTDSDGASIDLGDAVAELGSVELVVTAARTFVLTAFGEEGTDPVEATVSVLVAAPATPQVIAFTATPALSVAGEPVVLAWETSGAEAVSIVDGEGALVDLDAAPAAQGQVIVHPEEDATYTLTATGPGGEAEATASVTVLSAGNIVRFESDAGGPVLPGTSVTLSWETVDATSVTLLEGDAVLLESDVELTSAYAVTVESTTTFTLRADGPAGLGALTVTVEVLPLIEVFTATPDVTRSGQTVTLAWRMRGALEAEIAGPGGFAHAIAAGDLAEGATSLSVPAGGTFVLTARSGDLVQSRSAPVLVTGRPIIQAFSADPGAVTQGETVTVSWSVDGADSAVLLADPGAPIVLQGADLVAGSRTLGPATGTHYTLRAENSEGVSQATVAVPVHPIPEIATFEAVPARAASGDETRIAWSTVDAVAVRLFEDGVDLQIDPEATAGERTATVLFDTVYTLEAENVLGHVVTADVHVTVGGPAVIGFEVTPDAVHPGETVVFEWAAAGGESLEIRDPVGEVVCEITGAVAVAGGTCAIAALQDGVYVLEVANSDGTDTAEATVFVTDGPVVRAFVADPQTVSVNDPVVLSWQVDGPVGGGGHTLVLEDGEGTPVDLGGADVHAGSVALVLSEAGVYPFTLTATAADLAHARSVTVEAAAQPSILALDATPDRLDTEGGTQTPTAVLSWTTENASELVLWQMSDAGVPELPALFESTDSAEVAAGSLEVAPTRNAVYRLIARNALGAAVQRDVAIWVDLPVIERFDATRPADGTEGRSIHIVNGEEVVLTWETHLADRVDLLPVDPVVTEYGPGQSPPTGGYLDLSARPGALALPLTTSFANGRAILDFPEGFTFPFYGVTYASAEVISRGYLTFEAGQSYPPTFPETSYPFAVGHGSSRNSMIAPFWDYLDVRNGTAEIWYELLHEGGERVLAIQWKGWDFQSSNKRTANLNFMVKLRETGVIEFHYGEMSNSAGDRQHFSDGSEAAIGFQDHDRRFGHTWRLRPEDPEPLTNTSVIFDFGRPTSGSAAYIIDPDMSLELERTTGFLLLATNESGQVSDLVTVTRWRDFDLLGPGDFRLDTSATVADIGQSVTLSWLATDATLAEIWESGAPVDGCSVTGALAAHGSCQVLLDEVRDFEFELRASNPVSSGTKIQTVSANTVLSIDAFDVSAVHLDGGESVTLTWETRGASSAWIDSVTHGGATAESPLDPGEIEAGDRVLMPSESTHYTLRIEDGETDRVRTATVSVYVDAARITEAGATATQIRPGETTELYWTASNAETVTLHPANPAEIDSDFVDIRPTGTRITEWTGSDTNDDRSAFINLPFDFAFPFDGQDRYAFTISVNGYVTLDHGAGTVSTPRAILPSSGSPTALFAPFWTNLVRGDDGEVHYEVIPGPTPAEDQLIIQWSEMRFASSSWNPSSLNFQAVFVGDGNVEFRYATMESDVTGGQARADGQGATIGWQNFAGDRGGMIDKLQNEAVPGGLSHRTWRVPSASVADGNVVVSPRQTTDYVVCASGSGLTDCETITIVVVEPGHVMFSEMMIDAPSIPDGMGEWFEIRNTTADPIDIQGWFVTWEGAPPASPSDFVLVPGGEPVVLPPGGFFVFARAGEEDNGGFTPDLVYGAAAPTLRPEPAGGRLRLYYGAMEMDEVHWDGSWNVVPDRSLSVDGSRLRGLNEENDVPGAWCTAVETYAPGLFGSPGALGRGCLHGLYDVDPTGAEWIEISETGGRLDALVGTTVTRVQEVPGGLDFAMPFFDRFVSGVWVTNRGVLSFDSLTTVTTFPPPIPSTNNPDNLVAPFWSNIRENGDGSAVYWDRRTLEGTQVLIVQWQGFQQGTNPGVLTFQVQLWQNGDVAIVMGENRSTGASESARDLFAGSSATVGIENHDGTDGVQFSRNEPILGRHTRVLFRRAP